MKEYSISEMKEFASFPGKTQRYIRCSLSVAYEPPGTAVGVWARDIVEEAAINVRTKIYASLGELRQRVPKKFDLDEIESLMPPLLQTTAFDLSQGQLVSFNSYRFLYERLLGALVRPWLPSAFCAAAALPHLQPTMRKELLESISAAAATAPGWSTQAPTFFPFWVEKVDEHI